MVSTVKRSLYEKNMNKSQKYFCTNRFLKSKVKGNSLSQTNYILPGLDTSKQLNFNNRPDETEIFDTEQRLIDISRK